ncbi:hypothetical protein CDAR_9961 [Caerostris darwini]|uniref:Uncharacterized protein n=1 Tax=Caerostris darwini TaxID=1538125 RepID=A0AAV4R2A3_9ARAC|nr:hypothetical protein CDAR_9961 [Caerostris darwini]
MFPINGLISKFEGSAHGGFPPLQPRSRQGLQSRWKEIVPEVYHLIDTLSERPRSQTKRSSDSIGTLEPSPHFCSTPKPHRLLSLLFNREIKSPKSSKDLEDTHEEELPYLLQGKQKYFLFTHTYTKRTFLLPLYAIAWMEKSKQCSKDPSAPPSRNIPPPFPMIQEFLFMERFMSFEHKWSENMVHGEKTIVSGEEQEIMDGDFYF